MDLDELYEICDECASYGDDYYFDKETRTIVHKTIEKIYDVSAVSIPANENTEIYARSFCEGVIENVKKEFQEHQRLIELINLKTEI